jgi:hypothetical protein
LRVDIQEAALTELDAALSPSLRRDGGFLARFRLRAAPIPDWLRSRELDANVRIEKLAIGGEVWALDQARIVWNGTDVRLLGVDANLDDARVTGQGSIDLRASLPRYRLSGRAENLTFRGGLITVDGTAETRGAGTDLLNNLHGAGSFSGEDLTLSPDAAFDAMNGTFELLPGGRLRLTAIQAAQGADSFTGQGATQADGRMLLDLTTGKRQVRVAVAK